MRSRSSASSGTRDCTSSTAAVTASFTGPDHPRPSSSSVSPANGSAPATATDPVAVSSTDDDGGGDGDGDADAPPPDANTAHDTPSASGSGGAQPPPPLPPLSERMSHAGLPADAACEDTDADIVDIVWPPAESAAGVPGGFAWPSMSADTAGSTRAVEESRVSRPRDPGLPGAAALGEVATMPLDLVPCRLRRREHTSKEAATRPAATAQHAAGSERTARGRLQDRALGRLVMWQLAVSEWTGKGRRNVWSPHCDADAAHGRTRTHAELGRLHSCLCHATHPY